MTSADWAARPFTVALSDGSTVRHVWYRFVDQPAIARLGLDGISIAPPSHGTLATLDPAQLVTPPPGLETGRVPIVIGQY